MVRAGLVCLVSRFALVGLVAHRQLYRFGGDHLVKFAGTNIALAVVGNCSQCGGGPVDTGARKGEDALWFSVDLSPQPPTVFLPEGITPHGAEFIDISHDVGIRDDRGNVACERGEAAGREFDSRGGSDNVLELVGLINDDDLVLGKHGAVGREVHSVEMEIHDDNIGLRSGASCPFGEAVITLGTVRCSRTFAWANADRRPCPG